MNEQTNPAGQTSLSLGERFRQAREAQNLTIDDVVAKTNLNSSILEKLESDGFEGQSVPAIFVNGYIRSYAQFLKLPAELWSDSNIGQTIENDLDKGARTGAVTNPYSSLGRWVGYLTALVVLVMAGMTALWWWENYQQSSTERDTLVKNYVSAEEKNRPADAVIQATPPTTPTEPAAAPEIIPPAPTANVPAAPAKAENVAAEPAATPTATVTTPAATPPSAPAEAMPVTETATAQSENPVPVPPQSAVENQSENQVVAAGGDELTIEVTGESCWITVRDVNRNALVQKEYKQGEILNFNAAGPYSLTIGAPGNVKITYKGQPYPLKVDGRVARFKLE